MALTRADIADRLQRRRGYAPAVAKQFTDTFFEAIITSLEMGEPVKLYGFGNFTLHLKNARPGRNPKTGEDTEISARRVVTFHCSGKAKAQIRK